MKFITACSSTIYNRVPLPLLIHQFPVVQSRIQDKRWMTDKTKGNIGGEKERSMKGEKEIESKKRRKGEVSRQDRERKSKN